MDAVCTHGEHRLNVLMAGSDEPWCEHLPRLLEPQGVKAIRAASVDEALGVIERQRIHAAVIGMWTPTAKQGYADATPGGLKLLRVIHRLEPPPPAVVVRDRSFVGRWDDRWLSEALKLDVFTVLDQPVGLEQMLEAFRRLVQRHYRGQWPEA